VRKILGRFSPSTLAVLLILLIGCGAVAAKDVLSQIDDRANGYKPYVPPFPSPELRNYEAAQKLYASPSTIIWCTTTWGNPSAPMVTVPIAGKLTSSSVSFFTGARAFKPGDDGTGQYTPERRSVDGMYHGSPPPYRYGFTPGGQYVDFSAMPVFCTTALTKFQRKETKVSIAVDDTAKTADAQAQTALKRGDHAGAQRILEQALGDQ
jgi:hypothetical protein